jgi:hypothetical protein
MVSCQFCLFEKISVLEYSSSDRLILAFFRKSLDLDSKSVRTRLQIGYDYI